MRAASSAEAPAGVGTADLSGLQLSRAGQLSLVAAGFIPLLHVAGVTTPVIAAAAGRVPWGAGMAVSIAMLYLAPPVLVRILWSGRVPPVRSEVGSPPFFRWWISAQLQIVFARLPALEELLRLVPGLYSAWLRLWGARIGSLVYWSPGVRILDRQWLAIGSRVVFGVGVRLNPHALARHRKGAPELFLGTISVGDNALIGGYSLLLPGCAIASGETTPPLRSIHAFSRWEGGRHVTRTDAGLAERDRP